MEPPETVLEGSIVSTAKRPAAQRHQLRQQVVGLQAVVGARRLQQGDGLGDSAALHGSSLAQDLVGQACHVVAFQWTISPANRCAHWG